MKIGENVNQVLKDTLQKKVLALGQMAFRWLNRI